MVMPPHSAHRAPHHTPQPLIAKPHPAKAREIHITQPKQKTRAGESHRATVIVSGNPATVQIHGSDATASWAVATNIDPTTLSVGQAVVGVVFNPADPNDGLLTGVY